MIIKITKRSFMKDFIKEFKEFAAEDTEETQSKLNYLQNKKGGK